MNDISKTFSDFARYRITSLFSVTTYYESGKKPVAKPYLCLGGLGLPNASYYIKDAPEKSKILLHYGKLLDKVGKELETEKLSSIIPLETFIAEKVGGNEDILKGSELSELCPTINWEIFWTNLEVSEWKDLEIKIESREWLRQINSAIKKFSIDEWKTLFTAHAILHSIRVLPHPFDKLYFDFF